MISLGVSNTAGQPLKAVLNFRFFCGGQFALAPQPSTGIRTLCSSAGVPQRVSGGVSASHLTRLSSIVQRRPGNRRPSHRPRKFSMNHARAANGNFIRAADIWDDKTTLTGFFDSISPSKSKLRSGLHLIFQHILYELDAGSRAFIKWR